jgi:hypothetical protein
MHDAGAVSNDGPMGSKGASHVSTGRSVRTPNRAKPDSPFSMIEGLGSYPRRRDTAIFNFRALMKVKGRMFRRFAVN